MVASEAAVAAAMEALGCERRVLDRHEVCMMHLGPDGMLIDWTDRGCPVAVAAADAAVDADRASIQAETLREAADEHYALADARPVPTGRIAESLRQTADWLRARADRIEVQP